jgi:hypothetical protein
MARFIANRGNAYRDPAGANGIGTGKMLGPVPGGWVQVVGQEGDIVPVTSNDMAFRDFQGLGMFVQSDVAVSIRYSLSQLAQCGSEDATIRDSAMWTAAQTTTPGDIAPTAAGIWVCAEVTFTSAGTVAFHAR